ncbi:MAG: hypothetical protein CV045_01555 [Cyanobacteria bacterium M5B4]|nr:DUF3365 domain-containing protein [Cyanobacteria bacterium KgW148]PLS69546.1 MAG: hypothetical protein CV045_01555 [Cyanobacteria bacterium M5B4]
MRRLITLWTLGLVLCLTIGFALPSFASVDPDQLGKAVIEIERLDQMRSGLASTLEGMTEEPTIGTFKAVCAPVGKQAQQIAQENGWQLRQVSDKYRNPLHKPQNLTEETALAEFREHPDLQGFWQQDEQGVRYFRRINVEASCLACHGVKEDRPSFVKSKYPEDLAYDFRVGDLRGMYSLIIPELQKALTEK